MIKTFTNEGDNVLDNVMGGGSTIIAAMRCNRNAIGIEMDKAIFESTKERIREETNDERNDFSNNTTSK